MAFDTPPIGRDAMIRVVWGEARGENETGQAAVAYTILKRASEPSWWGRTLFQVCHHPSQFSCLNANDPNFPKVVSLDPDSADYLKIASVVDDVLAGVIPDPCASIGGASHYKVAGTPASWDSATVGKPSVTIGHHVFFNLGPSA